MPAPIPRNENERIEALYKYNVLDSTPEPGFDELTELIASICDVPIALVTLVDKERQWMKSNLGLPGLCETTRDTAFCSYCVLTPGLMVVPDTLEDERFSSNPLVTGAPFIRFYAGAPLVTPEGYAIGSLCVIDTKPRTLTAKQLRALSIVGQQAMDQLELRRAIDQLVDEASVKHGLNIELEESAEQLRGAFASMHDGIVIQDRDLQILSCNPMASKILGLSEDQLMNRSSYSTGWSIVDGNGSPYVSSEHPAVKALRDCKPYTDVLMGVIIDGRSHTTWISVNAIPLFRKDEKEPYNVMATFRDVTIEREFAAQVEREMLSMSENAVQLANEASHYEQLTAHFRDLSEKDGLTGIRNRRSFNEALERYWQSSDEPSLLLIDVDHFKPYNDKFGHPAGDEKLRKIASIIEGELRASECVYRFGGEEFAVILPRTEPAKAQRAASRIRAAVEKYDWQNRAMTVSIGIATRDESMRSSTDLLSAADEALYQSKRMGRNRCTLYRSSSRLRKSS